MTDPKNKQFKYTFLASATSKANPQESELDSVFLTAQQRMQNEEFIFKQIPPESNYRKPIREVVFFVL